MERAYRLPRSVLFISLLLMVSFGIIGLWGCGGGGGGDDDDPNPAVLLTWYNDSDNDGYGDPNITIQSATQPIGCVSNSSDCDDLNQNINPAATEICGDGIDQDCSGSDLICSPNENDVDNDSDGYTENQGDCNDSNSSINPGVSEICNDSFDNDCDGFIDCNDNGCSGDPVCITGNIAVFGTATFDGGYIFDE